MARTDRLIRRLIRETFVVTTASEETFEGVLVDVDDAHLVLANASQIAPNGDRVKVDGHLWLPRTGVRYMQRPAA